MLSNMKKLLTLLCILHYALCTFATYYYQPQSGFVGDPMPFYDPVAQTYRIYYLQEFRPNGQTYHPIYAVETSDLCSYTTLGSVLPTGSLGQQDAAIGTGSVTYIPSTRTYIFYYTGHNDRAGADDNKQKILRATSSDGIHWVKDASFALSPSPYYYYQHDFRDADVFQDDNGLYHMLVTTGKDGKHCLAEFTSSDCRNWTHRGIFMNSMWDRFYECPDVFKMGGWWYMVYSELHSDIRRVQYFKATTLDGLRRCTANDVAVWPDDHEGYLDSRGLYAGKTASDGTDRYLWGWCPTRQNQNNTITNNSNGEPDWAGTMVAHRIVQHEDGTLTLGPIASVEAYHNSPVDAADTSLSQGQHLMQPAIAQQTHLSFDVQTTGANDKFGISFCRNSTQRYYSLVVNPEGNGRRKINFEEEGTSGMGFVPYIDSYVFAQPANQTYHVDIYIDGSVLVMYINDVVCYTNRIYGMQSAPWSINCYTGSIRITDMEQATHDPTIISGVGELTTGNTHPAVYKRLVNGQIYIRRGDKRYNLMGAER